MRYMLDTNICIYLIKKNPPQVAQQLINKEAEGVGISSITMAELQFGAVKSGSKKNLKALENFIAAVEVAEFDQDAALEYGKVWHSLESQGKPIGPLDTQIAAHAISINATLVTNNTREFSRVQGLRYDNWV